MADKLKEEHRVRLFWYVRGVTEGGKKREAIYCTKKIVAFKGKGELDCTTEAGRCDFIEFRHRDRCCRCRWMEDLLCVLFFFWDVKYIQDSSPFKRNGLRVTKPI